MTKQIPLTRGYVALVDDEDYEWLMQWKWSFQPAPQCQSNPGYAKQHAYINGKNTTIRMHRFITNAPHGAPVDHRDGNGLNNTRANIRVATPGQNRHNAKANRNSSSQHKGVTWDKARKKWHAQITVSKKKIHIGFFNDPIMAAKAYDEAAQTYYGQFANTNFNKE